MQNVRLTFNDDRSYGWEIPVTLRSKKPLHVTLTFKDGSNVTYKDVLEYDHMFVETHDVDQTAKACVEFKDGNYATHRLNDIQSIHVTDNPL